MMMMYCAVSSTADDNATAVIVPTGLVTSIVNYDVLY